MIKKELIIPISIIGLSITFAVITALLFFTKGNKSLIKRKLKIGAVLLGLTAVVNSCGPLPVTCYDPIDPNNFSLSGEIYQNGKYVIDLSQSTIIPGKIHFREGYDFSFRITDSVKTEKQRNDIFALDGAYNEDTEDFEIPIDTNIAGGNYKLWLFDYAKGDQPDSLSNYHVNYDIKIIK